MKVLLCGVKWRLNIVTLKELFIKIKIYLIFDVSWCFASMYVCELLTCVMLLVVR